VVEFWLSKCTNEQDIMIQDDIIHELQFIPEAKLFELYDFIHYFRLGLNAEKVKIDKTMCLESLKKIQQGDLTGFSEIQDINAHIQNLKNEIS
jgi:hypothetical protein